MSKFKILSILLSLKPIKVLKFIFLIFYLYLNTTSSLLPNEEQIFLNPFIVNRTYPVKSIDKVKADKQQVGYINHPEDVFINFKVMGEDGVVIPYLPKNHFSYRIRKNQYVYTLKHDTFYQGSSYFARLKMPKVTQGGTYNFDITVFGSKSTDSKNQSSSQVRKVLPNFFFYRQKKIDIVFLIDNSGSMNRNDPKQLRYRSIYNVLKNPKFASKIDELAVISFSDDSRVVFPFGKTSSFLRKKIFFSGQGYTDFNKPFLMAENLIRIHRQKDQDQKVVIFLTDGTANYTYVNEHLKMKNLGIPVYTIGLFGNNSLKEYQPDFLRKVANDTRGDFFEVTPNVIGKVFKKFIDLSSAPNREFVVMPLKKSYAYNELIGINYRASRFYEKKMNFQAYLLDSENKNDKKIAEIYKKELGKIFLYPPIPVNSSATQISLEIVFRLPERILFEEVMKITIGKQPQVMVSDLIYFRQIDFLNYDIRYFSLSNHSSESLFIDIFFPKTNFQNIPKIVFKEIPFMMPPNQKRFQEVVFYPFKEPKVGENRVIDFVLKTPQGNFLNQINFDFLSQVKKNSFFSSPFSKVSSSQLSNWFLFFFFGINFFFLFLLVLKIKKNKKP